MSTKPEALLIENRKKKFQQLLELGVDPYPHKFDYTHTVSQVVDKFSPISKEELEKNPTTVKTCGRITSIRGFGKASFCHITDGLNKVQFYIKKNEVDEKTFDLFKLLDVGDIVGIEGPLFRTKTGELTLLIKGLIFLAKCFLPMPEKWHGLTDVEIRYRQRYLDLIVNPEVRRIFDSRSKIIRKIRNFLEDRRYLEVETPMMHPIVGGAAARPFITHHNTLDMDLYLRIAPELYLKRLVVGGMERVYEINRNFRNEGISTQHNPEFTMVEFYQAYSDFRDLMTLTKELLNEIVDDVVGSRKINFKDMTIDFDNWQEYTLRESIIQFWKSSGSAPTMEELNSREGVISLLKRVHIEFDPTLSHGALLGHLFEETVENQLVQPTFIYEYPIELSPLSKKKKNEPGFVERFELFIAGMEIANAYSELNDPEDQRQRFLEQVRMRESGDDEAQMMDEDYIRALSFGMPPAAGEGIGIDRLVMVLTDSPSIRDVILFPLMKPERP